MLERLEAESRGLAAKIRVKYNIHPLEPLEVFNDILPFTDIICLKQPLPDDISGICSITEGVRAIIINTAKTIGHQNFTVAHELYHAECQNILEDQVCKAGQFDYDNEAEVMADLFAANLLMPEDALRYHLYQKMGNRKKIELRDVINLEQVFQVSHLAMLRRLKDLKIIKDQQRREFQPNIRKNCLQLGFSDILYQPSKDFKLISDYLVKINLAYEKGKITQSRYYELIAELGSEVEINFEGVEDYVD